MEILNTSNIIPGIIQKPENLPIDNSMPEDEFEEDESDDFFIKTLELL